MDRLFYIDYQTIDRTKRMKVKAPDKPTAQARAEEFLRNKYGEVFTIKAVMEIPGGEFLDEQIAEYVMLGNFYRHDCETEEEAKELAEKINRAFKKQGFWNCFWALRFGKAVHSFPVTHVQKGSLRWKELKGEIKQDKGWYGRR